MENEIKIARPFERCEFKLAISDPSENYARIVCEPLERGFGTTLGNALRREYYYQVYLVLAFTLWKLKVQFMNLQLYQESKKI